MCQSRAAIGLLTGRGVAQIGEARFMHTNTCHLLSAFPSTAALPRKPLSLGNT